MPSITHLVKQDATVRTASTAAAELTDYTISWSNLTAAGFAAGDSVAILVAVKVWGSSANGNYSFAVGFGTTFAGRTEDTSSASIIEPIRADSGMQYQWLDQRTLVTSENIYFRSQGSTGTASYDDFFCLIVKTGDLNATDWLYAENAPGTTIGASYDTNGAGATTGAAGDWLLFSSLRIDSGSVGALMWGAIHDGTADQAEVRVGSGDTNDFHVFGTMAYRASLGSGVTVRARYRAGTAGVHTITNTRIFGLRLDAFEDHAGQHTTNTVTHSVLDTFSEYAGFGSYGLTTTGPFVVMGWPIHTFPTANTVGPYSRIQIGGSDWPVAGAGRTPVGDNSTTAIIAPFLAGYAASQGAGTLDIDLDAAEDFDVSPTYNCTTQVAAAFSLTFGPRPSITSVDTDDDTVDTRTSVPIVGTAFGSAGTGSFKVEVSNNAVYGSGTVVQITATYNSSTSITATMQRSSDSAALAGLFTLPLSPAYLWVTDSAGSRSIAGFQFTLRPSGPTPFAALNTNATLTAGTKYLLRYRVENSGGLGGTDFKWQYNHQGAGYVDLTTSSTHVQAVAGAAFANNDDVPELLTGSGSYVVNNDAASEDGTVTLAASFPGSSAVEFVVAVLPIAAQLANSDTIAFRVVQGDGTALGSYAQTFTATITGGELGGGTAFDTGTVAVAGNDLLAAVIVVLDTDSVAVAGNDLTMSYQTTLDTGAVTVAGNDLAANVRAVLDTGAATAAGADLTILEARTLTLDTGAVTGAGADLLMPATAVLDAGAVSAAGADLAANLAVTLDVGVAAVAGNDLTILEAKTLTLDVGAVTSAGADLVVATMAVLDSGATTVAGADLAVLGASVLELDVGAVAVAGVDLQTSAPIVLDTGAVSAAGADLTILEARTVALDTGAATVAGVDLVVLAPSAVTFDAGSAAVAGVDLTILEAKTLALDTGAASAAGIDLTILEARTLALDAGAATAAGNDLTILEAKTLALDTGAVTLAGNDLAVFEARTVALDVGVATVAGNDLAFLEARTITLDVGTAAVAGADVEPEIAVLLDVGAATVAGADLAASVVVPLDTSAVAVAGQDVTPLAAGTVLLDNGAVGVASADLVVLAPSTLVLDVGAVAGSGADLGANLAVLVDQGATTVIGADLTPLTSGAVVLDVGAAVVAGADLVVLADQTLALDQGAVAATGVDLGVNTSIAVDQGAATAAGQDLAILEEGAVALDGGAVGVAGNDLVPQLTNFTVEAGAVAAASADLGLSTAITVDVGALAATGDDLVASLAALLDQGAVALDGAEWVFIQGEMGSFVRGQHFVVAFNPGGQKFEGLVFNEGQSFEAASGRKAA